MTTRRDFLRSSACLAAMAGLSRVSLFAQGGDDAFTIAAVGDCIINRPFEHDDPATLALLRSIRDADAAFANVEITFPDPGTAPAATGACGDLNNSAEGPMAEELRWAGFDIVSTANNHSLDYGEEGMFATASKLERAGIAHAGTGRNLADATAPAFYDSRRGRVALIACASTIRPWSLAADGNDEIPGRPGLNPLRFRTTYKLSAAQLKSLEEISHSLFPNPEAGLVPQAPQEGISFLGNRFVAADAAGVATAPDPTDLARITAAVRRAARNAGLVLVSIHAHESGTSREVPAAFLVDFARKCIDAGAHMFIGHGPHILRGVEIYKQRPIFYSLANFIFQAESMRQIPQEIYSRCGIEGRDPSDFFDRAMNGFSDAVFWESAIARVEFRGGRATSVTLLPITLQQDLARARRGTPILAPPAAAARIVERVARLSQPFGARVAFSNGAGVVQLA
ncbi:MAG TPA: CapA family protein [Terriglobales bacterium]|nr:CapA family protein [Terriglobales bacterium]